MLKLKLQYFGHLMRRTDSLEKTLGKDRRQEEKRATEDEMVGWYHQLNGHEFEQTPGDSEGQGSLACWSPRGCKESATTGQLNNNKALSQARKPRLGHKEEGAFVTTQFQKHYTKPRHILAFKFFSHVSYGKESVFFLQNIDS